MSEHDEGAELSERVDALAVWIKELDAQLRANSTVGDPKALKELAKALEAWNKHDPKLEQRLTNRVDVLADRFATLAGTVNVTATSLAGKDGEIASLRRELEEGTTRLESVVRDLRQAGGSDLTELRKTVAELSSERKSQAGDSRVDAISGEVDVLAQRLDTLSKTVSTTAAGIAGREGELTTLRAQLEETDLRAGTLVIELRESIDALSGQVAGLEQSSGNAASIEQYENYVRDLAGHVEHLTENLDAVSTSVATATESIAANELELEAANRRFEAASADVESLILELQATVSALPSKGTIDPEVEDRLLVLGQRIDEVTGQLTELEETMTAQWHESATSEAAIEHELGQVSQRLADVEHGRDAALAALDCAYETWAEERVWVRGQLEQLASAVDDARADGTLEPRLQELAARVEAMEAGHESVTAEVARTAAAWDAERDELRIELEALAGEVSALPAPAESDNVATVELLNELTQRLDSLEREKAAVATEIGKAHELAARVEAMEAGHESVTAEVARTAAAWDAERDELRIELEALAGEVSALPAPAESDNVATVELLNELMQRLDSLEREKAAVATEIGKAHELAARVEAMEAGHESVTAEVARTAAAWDAERDELRIELEALAGEVSALPAPAESDNVATVELLNELMQRLDSLEREKAAVATEIGKAHELAARVEAMEAGHESVTAEVARTAAAWDAERDELRIELEALAGEVSALPAPAPATSDSEDAAVVELFNDLAQRLDSLEREKATIATEIGKAHELWASEIGALEARLDDVAAATPDTVGTPNAEAVEQIGEIARRLEAVENERGAMPDTAAVADELRDLRVLMNGLRMRLTSSEKELATLSSQGDVASRFDDISFRLASLERASVAYAAAPAPPVPGDGRFRVEMRGLDQRMEQLEAAARENRDAVLMQFERLASRLQWRLQQLELESNDAGYSTKASSTSRGRVVPIRSEG